MKTRLLILAALLILFLASSITGLLTSRPRDPILGTWRSDVTLSSITFLPDGTFSSPTRWGYEKGPWRAIPGPYYAPNPRSLGPIIDGQYSITTDYVSADQLTPEHYQQALAQNALQLTPASARVRLYECHFYPVGLTDSPSPASPPARFSTPFILEGEELNLGGMIYRRQPPETWLTRAWDWLKGILPP